MNDRSRLALRRLRPFAVVIILCHTRHLSTWTGVDMAKKRKKRAYKVWTNEELKALRRHSRVKTPVAKMAKNFRRTEATIRMKAYQLGLSVGHRRRRKSA